MCHKVLRRMLCNGRDRVGANIWQPSGDLLANVCCQWNTIKRTVKETVQRIELLDAQDGPCGSNDQRSGGLSAIWQPFQQAGQLNYRSRLGCPAAECAECLRHAMTMNRLLQRT